MCGPSSDWVFRDGLSPGLSNGEVHGVSASSATSSQERAFGALASDVFSYNIDDISRRNRLYSPPRARFWRDVYSERPAESDSFGKFLESRADVGIVSGCVGAGKSTLLRHKVEFTKSCDGIFIDMSLHQDKLLTPRRVAEKLKKIVGRDVRDALRDTCRWHLTKERCPGLSMSRVPNWQLSKEEQKVWRGRTVRDRARVYLAAFAVYYLGTKRLRDLRTEYAIVASSDEDHFEQLVTRLSANSKDVERVIRSVTWRQWVRLYRAVFHDEAATVIILDNIDALNVKVILPSICECVFEMVDLVNRDRSTEAATGAAGEAVKFVFVVRDENISRAKLHVGASVRVYHLRIGPDARQLAEVLESAEIPTTIEFVDAVVLKRLEVLRRETTVPELYARFERLIRSFWLKPDQGGRMTTAHGRAIDVCRLNNYSVRLVLEMLVSSCLYAMANWDGAGLEEVTASEHSATLMKGMMLQAVLRTRSMSSLISCVEKDMRRETTGGYCCAHRILLTYLSQRRRRGKAATKLSVLADRLVGVFEYDDADHVKRSVYELWQTGGFTGEAVTIDQLGFPESPDGIQDDAEIRCNGRGESLIANIMIQIDFFGALQSKSTPLFSLPPEEATDYVAGILRKWVRLLQGAHLRFWGTVLFRKFRCEPAGVPFQLYAQEFAFGGEFFVVRVADSHMNAIKVYIAEALRGSTGTLLLSKTERGELDSTVTHVPRSVVEGLHRHGAVADDEAFMAALALLPAGNPLVTMWSLYEEYAKGMTYVRGYARRTLKELGSKTGFRVERPTDG